MEKNVFYRSKSFKTRKKFLIIKFQSIRNTTSKEYYDIVERNYYKYTVRMPIVYPNSTNLRVGNTYKAAIMMACYNPQDTSSCEINGKYIKKEDGLYYLNIPCKKRGRYIWNGKLNVLSATEEVLISYPITGDFIVR